MTGLSPTTEQIPFIPVHSLLWRLPYRLTGTSLPLTLPGLWHHLLSGGLLPVSSQSHLSHSKHCYITALFFSSYLILVGRVPRPHPAPSGAMKAKPVN